VLEKHDGQPIIRIEKWLNARLLDPKRNQRNSIMLQKNIIQTEDTFWGFDAISFDHTYFDVGSVKTETLFSTDDNHRILFQNMFIMQQHG
jgi:hypothetical protein